MALQHGSWNIDGNGYRGKLNIGIPDPQGNLVNSNVVYDGGPVETVTGFWDDVSKKITFIREISLDTPAINQIYTGFLLDNRSTGDRTYILTGYYEAFQGSGAVAQRVLYGWYATIRVIE